MCLRPFYSVVWQSSWHNNMDMSSPAVFIPKCPYNQWMLNASVRFVSRLHAFYARSVLGSLVDGSISATS